VGIFVLHLALRYRGRRGCGTERARYRGGDARLAAATCEGCERAIEIRAFADIVQSHRDVT